MFDKIMVCLDGSKLAEQVLPYAIEQAVHFSGKLILFRAITLPAPIGAAAGVGLGGEVVDAELRSQDAEARDYLEKIAQPLRAKQINVETVTLLGDPGDSILAYAEREKVNLIALATHGHSGLSRAIFGSTADFVLHHTSLPILLIKPKAA